MVLKLSSMDGRSAAGFGLREPKKADGLAALETDRVLCTDDGLDGAFEGAVGLKVGALAFGLNSMALTLNLVETAEVGVLTLDRCGLDIPDWSAAGPVGGKRGPSWIGIGGGILCGMLAFRSCGVPLDRS